MRNLRFVSLMCVLLLLLGGTAHAQWPQTNGPYGGDVSCFAVSGTNLFTGQIIATFQIWQNNSWVNFARSTTTYDASGRVTLTLVERFWNGAWVDSSRDTYSYSYDSNGNLTKQVQTVEVWQNNSWVNSQRLTTTYDSSGRVTLYISEQFLNGDWVNKSRTTYSYSYDANGNLTEQRTTQVWQNNSWVNSSRTTVTHDSSGAVTIVLVEQFLNGAWIDKSRTTYTYDANGNLTQLLTQVWQNNSWVNSSRTTITYDSSARITIMLVEQFSNGAWVNSSRQAYSYSYDANGKLTEAIVTVQVWQNDSWVNLFRMIISYMEATSVGTGSPDALPSAFRLLQNYPNPFNPSTTISFDVPQQSHVRLVVCDVLGREVRTLVDEEKQPGRYSVTFDASNLPTGVYLYRLSVSGGPGQVSSFSEVRKMLVVR